jgi:hypothetical protein
MILLFRHIETPSAIKPKERFTYLLLWDIISLATGQTFGFGLFLLLSIHPQYNLTQVL